ncbi:MAG: hypothetical protein O3C10_11720 [Chloroflexi bacterium]|nr:hypothetical protein [Chloroflexota bacterium]
MIDDYRKSDLDAVTKAMCDYAVKLTSNPEAASESDVEGLRAHGLSDKQILSVVLITCQFNFSNRLTMGLGIEPPPGRSTMLRRWLTGPAQDFDWLKYDEDEG